MAKSGSIIYNKISTDKIIFTQTLKRDMELGLVNKRFKHGCEFFLLIFGEF